MLMMVEKSIRGGMCHAVHGYIKANNKYLKNYHKNTESSYLEYLDANNLYGYAICKKLSVSDFKWVEKDDILKFDEKFMKNYNENSDKVYILGVDVKYPKSLHTLHKDLPFLLERMKINKCTKLVCNAQDKENYVVHIRALKQALDHGLIFKKVHRVIELRQEAWLKPYIDINTNLQMLAKNSF